MTNKPKQIKFELEDDSNMQAFLQSKKYEFSKTIAQFLCWALENNIDSFIFAEAEILHAKSGYVEILKLGCKRDEYLDALQKQLKNLIEFEEYEMCPKIQEWIDYLEIEEKVKK